LAAKDFSKTSDPIVYIEAFEQTQNTSVQPACLSCVYDELFIFNFRNMDKDVFSEGLIKIKVPPLPRPLSLRLLTLCCRSWMRMC
jgi:hypothetical protein